jgi:pimeloyl-ACP methyl ester carboxylesterase
MTIALIAIAVVAAVVVAALTARQVRRNRISEELRFGAEGIAESRYVKIGGIDQWIQIRGENKENPVLFVLHGGPGSPYAVFTPLIRSWEKHYTVVQWDRRGCGMTRRRSGNDAGTFGRLVDDAVEAAEWVTSRRG